MQQNSLELIPPPLNQTQVNYAKKLYEQKLKDHIPEAALDAKIKYTEFSYYVEQVLNKGLRKLIEKDETNLPITEQDIEEFKNLVSNMYEEGEILRKEDYFFFKYQENEKAIGVYAQDKFDLLKALEAYKEKTDPRQLIDDLLAVPATQGFLYLPDHMTFNGPSNLSIYKSDSGKSWKILEMPYRGNSFSGNPQYQLPLAGSCLIIRTRDNKYLLGVRTIGNMEKQGTMFKQYQSIKDHEMAFEVNGKIFALTNLQLQSIAGFLDCLNPKLKPTAALQDAVKKTVFKELIEEGIKNMPEGSYRFIGFKKSEARKVLKNPGKEPTDKNVTFIQTAFAVLKVDASSQQLEDLFNNKKNRGVDSSEMPIICFVTLEEMTSPDMEFYINEGKLACRPSNNPQNNKNAENLLHPHLKPIIGILQYLEKNTSEYRKNLEEMGFIFADSFFAENPDLGLNSESSDSNSRTGISNLSGEEKPPLMTLIEDSKLPNKSISNSAGCIAR